MTKNERNLELRIESLKSDLEAAEKRADMYADLCRGVTEVIGLDEGSSWHDLPEKVKAKIVSAPEAPVLSLDDEAERAADQVGIYGAGPEEREHPDDCKCRMCFVENYKQDHPRLAPAAPDALSMEERLARLTFNSDGEEIGREMAKRIMRALQHGYHWLYTALARAPVKPLPATNEEKRWKVVCRSCGASEEGDKSEGWAMVTLCSECFRAHEWCGPVEIEMPRKKGEG